MSVWRNDIKCKYMFMFPLKNWARKELMSNTLGYTVYMCSRTNYYHGIIFIVPARGTTEEIEHPRTRWSATGFLWRKTKEVAGGTSKRVQSHDCSGRTASTALGFLGWQNNAEEWGISPWWPLLGLLSWCPVFKRSHCISFEDWVPVDEIYGYPIFKWNAVT